jgi:hypothetical protein
MGDGAVKRVGLSLAKSVFSFFFSRRLVVALLLPLDDADATITLNVGMFYFWHILQPLLAELQHQLVFRDELLSHIPAEHLPIFDQKERRLLDQTTEPFWSVT